MADDSILKNGERGDLYLLWSLAAVKFLIHVAVNAAAAYGYFRDEFYYIACSDHLAFGYVDQPPLSILLLKMSRVIFGDSLTALRVLPAIAGALTVILAGLMARALGGGRFAQLLAALCVLSAPLHLGINGFYSMNSFDILIWTAAAYIIMLWIRDRDPGLWLWLGVLLGLGLLNKISVLWLGLGLAAGLLFTRERRCFLTRGPWLAAGIAFLIFLPHIVWQVHNGWPTLQFMAGAADKMIRTTFAAYLGRQIMDMHPLLFPLWLTGLAWYLFSERGRPFRALGIIYISVFALLVISGTARSAYLAPSYPMLFAPGALVFEKLLSGPFRRAKRSLAVALIIAGGIATAPLVLPVIPAESYIRYSDALGLPPYTDEKAEMGKLPQFFADMNGWEEIVASLGNAYDGVRGKESGPWAVFALNYGVAGAVDFFGKQYGLPGAISGHNSYWMWGPGDPPPRNLLIVGGRQEDYNICGDLEQAGVTHCAYCMPYENNNPIYVCRDIQVDADVIWPEVKHFE